MVDMTAKYDAVVIGAGNGGLTAAATLAKVGKRVLVLEQHNTPGGFASSFVRGRFEFEPSLHELCDFGTEEHPGDVRRLFDELGVKLDWCPVPDAFRTILINDPDLKDYTMPFGTKAFVDKMEEYVPGSRPSMEKFISLCEDLDRAIAYMSAASGNVDPKVMQREHANFLKCAPYPVSVVLDALKMPKAAQKILGSYWCYIGVDLERLSFFFYAIMVYKYLIGGACVPAQRSHSISVALTDRILELGGDIWCSTRAEKILMKDGHPYAVRTSKGDIETRHVICCCSPHAVFGDMMDAADVPEAQRRDTNAREFGMRGFVAYVGLNRSPEELGLKDYSYFIYNSMDTADECRRVRAFETNDVQATICLNIANPHCSPAGTTTMSFTTFFNSDVWDSVKPEDYVKTKRAVAAHMFEVFAQQTGVDIRPYIEEIEIATPATLARYTLNPKGVMYAYAGNEWDSLLARLMMLSEDVKVPGIRFAGAYGPRFYGFSSTYVCGELIGKLTMADMKEDK